MFDEWFPDAQTEVTPYGNVLSAMSYLHGLASEELATAELDYVDPDFEVIVGVRARKAGKLVA